MSMDKAMDVLVLVVLSGAVRPAQMELVCLTICNACREGGDYSIVVNKNNTRLVSPQTQRGGSSSGSCSGNITNGGVLPPSPPSEQVCSRLKPHRRIHRLGFRVDLPLSRVVWPEDLRTLKFGWMFDHPLDRPLPSSLTDLDLGSSFNHHVEEVAWPATLQRIAFGERFNRQIELTTWPASLRRLTFGSSFDQPIAAAQWPASLEVLVLGDAFNHPIQSSNWAGAPNLKRLEFGMAFRCSVDGVAWPSGLRELKFGACFDQRLEARDLPRSLRLLRLADVYSMHTAFDSEGLPRGCRLRIDRTEMFDLLSY